MAALTCSACQLPEQGFRQVRQGSKTQKYPWHWRSEHVWTEYLPPQRVMVMPWQNMAMVPLRSRYLYIMLLWCDAVSTHSTCVEVWQQLDERIHNRPSLPIRKHFGLWNTSNLTNRGVDGLPHDKKILTLSQGHQKLSLLARVRKSPLRKVVASCLSLHKP